MSDLGTARGRIVIDTSDLRRAQQEVQGASRAMSQALNALGLAFSAREIIQFAVEADRAATAFRRQSIAARELAGSQGRVNELLAVYNNATGNAVDQATALSNVTQLIAVGFADSARELDEFVRAARGISLATGRTQEFVITQLQLELLNQTGFRLDQIGLGMEEVRRKADQLRASNSRLTQEQAYQQAVIDTANQKYSELTRSIEAQATGVERTARAWKELQLAIGEAASGPLDAFGKGLALFIDVQTARLRAWIKELDVYIRLLRQMGMAGPWLTSGEQEFVTDMGSRTAARRGRGGSGGDAGVDPELQRRRTEAITQWARDVADIEKRAINDRLAAAREYEQQRTQTIRDYGKTMLREAEDFARNRVRQEQDFAKSIAEVQRDAAERELQQIAQLERTIAQARQDSADRLADMQVDLERTIGQRRADSAEKVAEWEADRNEAIAERRADGNKRLLELEDDYNRQRERAEQQNKLRLNEAAARLDARAVFFEQQRFEEENRERREAHQERVQDEREKLNEAIDQINKAHDKRIDDEAKALNKSINQAQEAHNRRVADEAKALDKRIRQAQEAHALQLENARLADAQRIEDMQADFALRLQREDEDRGIRLGRLAADHQAQLTEMATQHGLRLAQIDRHAQEERTALDEDFQDRLSDLDLHNENWMKLQEERQREALALFDAWWEDIKTRFEIGPTAPGRNPSLDPRRTQLQGAIDQRQAERRAHPPGTPEWNRLTNEIIELQKQLDALRGGAPTASVSAAELMASTSNFFSMPAMAAAATGTGGSSVVVQAGAVVIHAAPGQSEAALGDIVEQRLLRAIQRATGAFK